VRGPAGLNGWLYRVDVGFVQRAFARTAGRLRRSLMLSAPSPVPDRLDVDAPAQQALHEFTVLRATALGSFLPLSLPDTPRA